MPVKEGYDRITITLPNKLIRALEKASGSNTYSNKQGVKSQIVCDALEDSGITSKMNPESNDEARYIRDGLFKVYRDGEILVRNKDGYKKASIHPVRYIHDGKEDFRLSVSYMENGKSHQVRAANLIAEGFVPNADGKIPGIAFYDGNPANISAENLFIIRKQPPKANQLHAKHQTDPTGFSKIITNRRLNEIAIRKIEDGIITAIKSGHGYVDIPATNRELISAIKQFSEVDYGPNVELKVLMDMKTKDYRIIWS